MRYYPKLKSPTRPNGLLLKSRGFTSDGLVETVASQAPSDACRCHGEPWSFERLSTTSPPGILQAANIVPACQPAPTTAITEVSRPKTGITRAIQASRQPTTPTSRAKVSHWSGLPVSCESTSKLYFGASRKPAGKQLMTTPVTTTLITPLLLIYCLLRIYSHRRP